MSEVPQPRSSWKRLAANQCWLLVGGTAFLVGALFVCLGLFDWVEIRRLNERFQLQGRTVQGTVLKNTMGSLSSGGILSRQYSNPYYYVTYRFRTPEGKEFEGYAVISRQIWSHLAEGGPIQIEYLPGAPLTNRVEGKTDLGSAAAQMLMGGLLAIGGAALVFWDLRRRRRKKRLQGG